MSEKLRSANVESTTGNPEIRGEVDMQASSAMHILGTLSTNEARMLNRRLDALDRSDPYYDINQRNTLEDTLKEIFRARQQGEAI